MGKSLLAAALIAFLAVTSGARANTDLDTQYALRNVGILRSWDNVDGLFSDYVAAACKDYFSRQSRFELQDVSKADPILLASKIPYVSLIDDPDVLGQIARASRAQSLIRTKIVKEGSQYRFTIEWLHAPEMAVMSRVSFAVDEPASGHGFGATSLQARIESELDLLIGKLPFVGAVTGRDGSDVTLNIGSMSGVKVGDTLRIATIEQAKRHPLLNEIVDWSLADTGKVRIDQVADRMSFGTVVDEEASRPILREQKVVDILHAAPVANAAQPSPEPSPVPQPPKLGFIAGGINLGSFSRSYSSLDNTIGKNGGGFAYGFKVDGQLWVTQNWFLASGLDFASWSYSQQDTLSGSSGASSNIGAGSLVGFDFSGGYSYLVNGDILGPKGWIKIGYRSDAYNLPDSSANYTTPIDFKSLYLGLGGDLPIRNGFGALLSFDIGVVNSATESPPLSGTTTSVSDVGFSLGGYYRFTQRISVRAAVDFVSDSADFTTQRTASQKVITFTPSVLYYF